jgi:putative ATPase
MQDDTSLFNQSHKVGRHAEPLAARMRPRGLDDIVGQDHILGPGKLLRRAIEADRLTSIILYGPPGIGKTSLAEVIAHATKRRFERASGAISSVADLRKIIDRASARDAFSSSESSRSTILFVDEIHRFNKAQQDVLLPHVEAGTVTLIGATTHNPGFFVNGPLTSRSLVFELKPLANESIVAILRRALTAERGLSSIPSCVTDEALAHLALCSEGDARRALNALEVAVVTTQAATDGLVHVTRAVAEESIQKKIVLYDKNEDGHYDTISAFIKSVRGSDPHAAVYWLAKMLYAGEDPRFVARRLVILASEDIGNADPRGLTLAVSAFHAVEMIGMPEARIILSQATTYLATAPKSNASYLAINKAMGDVESGRTGAVPENLKNVQIKALGHEPHEAYKYPHDFSGAHVEQRYMNSDTRYYEPTQYGYEELIQKRMKQLDERKGGSP